MKRALALVVLGVLGFAPGCSKRALGQDEGRLSTINDGRAEVAWSGNRPWHEVNGRVTLKAGDRVRVTQGGAVVRLTDGRAIELRRGSQLELGSPPRLLAGDLLATAGATPIAVSASGTDVKLTDGLARLSRRLALVAATYRGTTEINSAGRMLKIPSLRQVAITAAGLLPARPSPLQYDALDAWDRKELGDAIELGGELVARSRGFTAQLAPGEGRTTGFYRQLLPDLERESGFNQSLLDSARSPGETLVGAAITASSTLGTFRDRWASVFEFRDEGAAWGLVALDQSVHRTPLLATVDLAIGRAVTPFGEVAAAAATPAPAPPPAPVPPAATEPVTSSGTRAPSTRTTPKPPAGTTPPPTTPPRAGPPVPPPIDQPTGGLLDTLGGLLDAVNGLLGGGGTSHP